MNSKKQQLFFYLPILFCVICSSYNINAQETKDGKPLDKIILAEQIPETTLAVMPTEQLIQEYLGSRYPRYLFLYAPDFQYAFKKAYADFNGLRELLRRPDVATSLIEIYQRMDPGAYEVRWDPVKKGQFSFYFIFIENLLSQGVILDSFTKSETKTILSELLKKNELKTLHPDLYSMADFEFNAFSIAKLLEVKGKDNGISQTLSQTPGIDNFLKSGILLNKEMISIIIQTAKEFLNIY